MSKIMTLDEALDMVNGWIREKFKILYLPDRECDADDCLKLSEAFRVIGEKLKGES